MKTTESFKDCILQYHKHTHKKTRYFKAKHILISLFLMLFFSKLSHSQSERSEYSHEHFFGEYICSTLDYEILSINLLIDSSGFFLYRNGNKATFKIINAIDKIVLIEFQDTMYCIERDFFSLNFMGFDFIRKTGYDVNQNLIYKAPIRSFHKENERGIHGRTKSIYYDIYTNSKCTTKTRYRKNKRDGIQFTRCGLRIIEKGKFKNDLRNGKFYVDLGRVIVFTWYKNDQKVKTKYKY